MKYDAIVIGAGVAGIFSAFILAKEGKKVLLLESQPVAGGYASIFKRRGFTFESALHCVDALGKGEEIRVFLEKYGLAEKLNFIDLEHFCRFIYPEHDFITDFKRDSFVGFLKEKFPAEKNDIDKLFRAIDKFYRQFDRFCALALPNNFKVILTPLFFPDIIKLSIYTAKAFIRKYISSQRLEALITDLWRFLGSDPSRLSAFYFLVVFRGYYYKPTSYIKGGFAKLLDMMMEQIRAQAGEIRFNSTVTKIITERNVARGVVTNKDEEFFAKVIISNVNAIDTLAKMLDNTALRERYQRELSGLEKSLSAVQVYLGLKVPAKNLGMNNFLYSINHNYSHDENLKYCLNSDYQRCPIEIVDHCQLDSSLAPEGKGTLTIMTLDSYANWENLSEEEYKLKKEETARILISRAQEYLPGLSQNIEFIEVASPRTMARFSASPGGAIYGFAQTPLQANINRLNQVTRVKGLYLAGAWTRPGGGVHGCFVSAVDAADLVLGYLKK